MNTSSKPIVVIYHRADFDGIFCREIARKFLGNEGVEYIGWDYGDAQPVVPTDCTLYMLDISIEGDLMLHPGLIWIDHHKSAIEKFSKGIPGYRIDGVAACRLAWFYFTALESYKRQTTTADFTWFQDNYPWAVKQDFVDRKTIEPLAVRLAGEYDIWDKRDPRAELFQHGLRSQDLDANLWRWMLGTDCDEKMMTSSVEALLKQGESLQYAQTRQNESIIKEIGFTIEFEGLKFLACNHARYNSHLFTAGLTPEHDACFGFKWTGKDWSVSLYHAPGKEHHDLSLIAVKHGGGGHRGACGFRTKTLPFLPPP